VVDERDRELAGLDADALLAELVDHVVVGVLAGAAGLAVADVGAGEVLELERDVLGDVAGPGAFLEPRDEAAAPTQAAGVVLEARQKIDQRVVEAGDLVAGVFLERAEVDEHPDDGLAGPVVGAAQDSGLDDAERGLRTGVGRGLCRASSSGRRTRLAGARFRCRLRHGALLLVSPVRGPRV